jgi:DNA-binding SARP family transcriptional activator
LIELRLLGQFNLQRDGRLVEIPSRPAQSLLAYLALTVGVAHRRERLAGLIWPDIPEADARRNLRRALWHIRKALEARPRCWTTSPSLSTPVRTPGSMAWFPKN